MTKKNTGFDAFFEVLTSSPEFKAIMEKDKKEFDIKEIKTDISKSEKNLKDIKKLKELKKDTKETKSIFESLSDTFITPEAIETGEKYKTETKEKKDEVTLDIKYFENKNPLTWGFLGVAGMEELKKELRESFINPLKFKFFIQKLKDSQKSKLDKKTKLYLDIYDKYEKFGVGIPNGIMFYGPPGTGKTFITKKLAEELGAGIIIKTVGEFGSSYIHQTSKNIRTFFQKAKEASKTGPLILFLDEIDSLVSKRTSQVDSNKAEEVSQFLQEINNLKEAPNLILIGATNRPDHLDSAIIRSGRFDKKIYIGPPDKKARKELFKIFIEKTSRPHEKLDYDELANLTDGYVASDIEAICDEASRDASNSLLDIMSQIQNGDENLDFDILAKNIHKNVINIELLRQAIEDTASSLKVVDMNIYTDWLEKLEGN